MTISISITRHTRKQGSQVRLIVCETAEEAKAVCSSNITTQGIANSQHSLYGWGEWSNFKESMKLRGIEVVGE